MTGASGFRVPRGISRRSRVPSLLTLCCVARLARDVDPSGAWAVILADPVPPFGTLAIPVNIQRSGTDPSTYVKSLSSFIIRGGLPYPLTGTIDAVSDLLVDDSEGVRNTDITVAPNTPQFGDRGCETTSSGWRFRGKGGITSVKIKRVASVPEPVAVAVQGKGVVSGCRPRRIFP
jgi:hypothetical protein